MAALDIRNLVKVYNQNVHALRGIDLTVDEGDFFAILGPNGAGKSTAIGIISSLINKTAGSVQVFGHDIDTDEFAVKSCIGLVPQEFNFDGYEPIINSIINVAGYNGIRRREAKKRAEYYLKKLDLWDKRDSIGSHLSGGMQRRAMIARALVHEPKLLILDEPTAGVDIEVRRIMWEYLSELNSQNGTSIILTTHYLEEAEELCRNVAIIDRGKIIERGSVAELLSRATVETYVLTLSQALTVAPSIDPFFSRLLSDQTQLEVDVPQGQSITDLIEVLTTKGIDVATLRTKSNRLEEFFVRLVNQNETELSA